MTYDFDAVIDRRGTSSVKWDKYRGRDIIPLWVADMDFASPPEVIQALHERVSHGVFGYTMAPDSLAQAVVASLAAEFDWAIRKEWLVWLPGLVSGLNIACRAVGAAGDEVVSFTPVYPPFLSAPLLTGRELIRVPLAHRAGGWGIDLEAVKRAVTPKSRLLLLCNPHNPVGRVWKLEELSALADLAGSLDLIICSDEIHSGLILEPGARHLPIATLSPEIAQRTITLQAPSKTFNIPGLGCSFAVISDQKLRRAFREAMGSIVPHVNLLGYAAAEACYRHGEAWRRELLDYLRGNRDLVAREVGRMPGLSVTPVEATYLAWIDTRAAGIENPAPFFEAAGVGLSDGVEFGLPGFVRLNFGCPRALLGQALERMHRALEGVAS